jgi:hypothetical protein
MASTSVVPATLGVRQTNPRAATAVAVDLKSVAAASVQQKTSKRMQNFHREIRLASCSGAGHLTWFRQNLAAGVKKRQLKDIISDNPACRAQGSARGMVPGVAIRAFKGAPRLLQGTRNGAARVILYFSARCE